VTIDPDEARDAACEATAGGNICDAAVPRDVQPVDVTVSSGSAGGSGALGLVLVIILVALLVAALGWLAKAWFDGRSPAVSGDEDDDELDEDLDEEIVARIIDHETPPERWRRAAAEHRAAGRYREAIRCEYRGLVGDLARAGFVDEIPGRTSGEEREQIADLAPRMARDFEVAADLFDEAWFNDDDVLAEHDRRFVDSSQAVLAAAGTTARATVTAR
jgi:hypothetical protein